MAAWERLLLGVFIIVAIADTLLYIHALGYETWRIDSALRMSKRLSGRHERK